MNGPFTTAPRPIVVIAASADNFVEYAFRPGPQHARLLAAADAPEPLPPSQRLLLSAAIEIYSRWRDAIGEEAAIEQAIGFVARVQNLDRGSRP